MSRLRANARRAVINADCARIVLDEERTLHAMRPSEGRATVVSESKGRVFAKLDEVGAARRALGERIAILQGKLVALLRMPADPEDLEDDAYERDRLWLVPSEQRCAYLRNLARRKRWEILRAFVYLEPTLCGIDAATHLLVIGWYLDIRAPGELSELTMLMDEDRLARNHWLRIARETVH